MRASAQKRLSVLAVARDAVRQDRIIANYQPKVDLRSGLLGGFEALLRWQHPSKGLQTADTIASAFQDGMLAAEISDRIIGYVIADMRRWLDDGIRFQHVAVNAAAAELQDARFADNLLDRLRRADLPPSLLQLEVTETVFLGRGAEYIEDALRALSLEGIQIALDDFGTGYASLSHLNKFPVHIIKIDRSFIAKLETSDHDATIVRAIIKLGRSLGIKTVAEGIETKRQAEFLRKHRCSFGQGFFFAEAVSAGDVPCLVTEWSAGGLNR
jgi:EAL domain-containing protein (putative c-di-GMP-specific phosphodiesterase class I)